MKNLVRSIFSYLEKNTECIKSGDAKNYAFGIQQPVGYNFLIMIDNGLDDYEQIPGGFQKYSQVRMKLIWFGTRDYGNSWNDATSIHKTLATYSRKINPKIISFELGKMNYQGFVDNQNSFTMDIDILYDLEL